MLLLAHCVVAACCVAVMVTATCGLIVGNRCYLREYDYPLVVTDDYHDSMALLLAWLCV